MGKTTRLTTEQFIEKARFVHGDKYDYSKVEYIDMQTKVCITCPIHGEFWQLPNNHIKNHGCPKCAKDILSQKKTMSTEDFIQKAKLVHGDKYDYSKVEYNGQKEQVCIICPIHGEFWIDINNFLYNKGRGCPKCGLDRKAKARLKTKEIFIEESITIHGDKYDYSKVEYKGNKKQVCIICPIHGEFWQKPSDHLRYHGCPKCSHEMRIKSKEEKRNNFIQKAQEKHNHKYDYSKVDYVDGDTKVCIICPTHGEFWQTPKNHMKANGCYECAKETIHQCRTRLVEDFLEDAKRLHGDKYDYSKCVYLSCDQNIEIICPIHGSFWMKPTNHIHKRFPQGCPKCGMETKIKKMRKDINLFIEEAKIIHGDRYDYSKVEYKNNKTKVCIICPIHGEFWQTPSMHLRGNGCPICRESSLERDIRAWLSQNQIDYIQQHTFEWLKYKSAMYFDFYLPKHNIVLECQGMQHFKPIKYFGGKEKYFETVEKDLLKKELCEQHGIKLLYYSNLGIEYPYEVIESKEKLIEKIYENNTNK